MVYGSATEVQNIVWGSAKSVVPAGITSALTSATNFINSELNIVSELTGDDLPPSLTAIANELAAGIIAEQKDPSKESQPTVRGKAMLQSYKDETSTKSRGESYHIAIVQPR
jgi:hypothetical protein